MIYKIFIFTEKEQMQHFFGKLPPSFFRFFAPVLCVALTSLILKMFQSFLDIQVIALLFLLPIMISTVFWGLTAGVLAGFTGFLVFNYYYLQPYNTLLVHQTQDIITLIIFLIVAVVLSQLIGQAREGMRLARAREWEATRMYELTSALSGLQETSTIARELAKHTKETFGFDRVTVLISMKEAESISISSNPGEANPSHLPTLTRLLETARGTEGELQIWHNRMEPSPQEARLLEAYTNQGALSLERIRLAKSENKARILEESDQFKSSLLNSVSHELRTPLAVIIASASSLRSGTVNWNTADRQELLTTIEEEAIQLNSLVGNLLDMSRIEAGALNPHQRWNTIEEIATGIAAKMQKQLSHHYLKMSFPKDLPLVPTDYVMIEQVFMNLISNSIKYAPVNTDVTIAARKEGEFLHCEVANQGPKVPEELLERIFDKFYRVKETERITGTGLGLSICKGIIEAHGGEIWAENRAHDFVFHFTLPLTLNGLLPQAPKEAVDE